MRSTISVAASWPPIVVSPQDRLISFSLLLLTAAISRCTSAGSDEVAAGLAALEAPPEVGAPLPALPPHAASRAARAGLEVRYRRDALRKCRIVDAPLSLFRSPQLYTCRTFPATRSKPPARIRYAFYNPGEPRFHDPLFRRFPVVETTCFPRTQVSDLAIGGQAGRRACRGCAAGGVRWNGLVPVSITFGVYCRGGLSAGQTLGIGRARVGQLGAGQDERVLHGSKRRVFALVGGQRGGHLRAQRPRREPAAVGRRANCHGRAAQWTGTGSSGQRPDAPRPGGRWGRPRGRSHHDPRP